jgi:diguanylate cyclase (GGDEF)-like protein
MGMNTERPASGAPPGGAPLADVLNQSEQVHDKVEQAALDLSAVNRVLKNEIAPTPPHPNVAGALRKSERVEAKVQEAAADLVTVNDALAKEVEERHELEQKLSESDAALSESRAEASRSGYEALHDALTGLPNLTLFRDRLRIALAQSERHAWRLAVMFIDLDGFKSLNDTHGHDAGDRVLQMVAGRLQGIVRKGDTVSRRSGDEFLFLMLEANDESNVAALASRLGDKIAEPYELDGAKVAVKASIGVALYPDDGRSAADLLKNADAAMYAAKRQNKGPVLFGRIERT